MGTFKADLFGICQQVAREFEGWSFVSGQFKNKTLKHTELIVSPGFGFGHPDSTPMQPAVWICNKKFSKLSKEILGVGGPVSVINFKCLLEDLQNTPENFRGHCWIEQDKKRFMGGVSSAKEHEEKYIDLSEAGEVLMAMMKDGINIFEKYYDLSGEDRLLDNLPPKYVPSRDGIYDEMERQKGVAMCIVRILLGDFDFVKSYRSDEFKTLFPKRVDELDKIIAALPELMARYAETGSVA
ncbi:hypothetical protein [Burkholderia ubonensis]|uniref:hypothetical protein n=1 Tax=Burkholderia ubonensis TaxID=101571 RepID=UPI000B1D5892|nr:hypothetical protein [Burkholderia ubonensis]